LSADQDSGRRERFTDSDVFPWDQDLTSFRSAPRPRENSGRGRGAAGSELRLRAPEGMIG
jgi:hypothetical protein